MEEVKIHVPEEYASGGKDSKGEPSANRFRGSETKLQPVLITAIVAVILGSLGICLAARHLNDKTAFIIVGLALLSPAVAVAGYWFFGGRDSNPIAVWNSGSGPRFAASSMRFCGGSTCTSVLIFPGELYQWLLVAPPIVGVGALAALSTFDLDYGSGDFHYCFYLLMTLILATAMGLAPLNAPVPESPQTAAEGFARPLSCGETAVWGTLTLDATAVRARSERPRRSVSTRHADRKQPWRRFFRINSLAVSIARAVVQRGGTVRNGTNRRSSGTRWIRNVRPPADGMEFSRVRRVARGAASRPPWWATGCMERSLHRYLSGRHWLRFAGLQHERPCSRRRGGGRGHDGVYAGQAGGDFQRRRPQRNAGRDNPLVVGPADFGTTSDMEHLAAVLAERLGQFPPQPDRAHFCPDHLRDAVEAGERLWRTLEPLAPGGDLEAVADAVHTLFGSMPAAKPAASSRRWPAKSSLA